MKILNIGYGKVGSILCTLLLDEKRVKSIICCDLKIINKIRNKRIIFKKLDAGNKIQLLELLKKERPDVVINTSLPYFNKIILSCCLAQKINYVDMASYWEFNDKNNKLPLYEVEQLKFNDKFKKNNLVGLINAGASPGLTNLLARECADQLDKTDTIRIRLIEDTNTDELCFAWSKEWLLDEIASKPLVYRNNKFEIKHCYSEEEKFEFPEKCGEKNVCLIAQEEVGTIPLFIKTKNVDIKMYDSQIEMAKFMHKLDLISKKEIRIGKEKISPLDFLTRILPDTPDIHRKESFNEAVFGLVVEAEGEKNGKKKIINYSVIFPKQAELNKRNIQASFIAYATAIVVKLFVLSIDRIKSRGVFPPEKLDCSVREFIFNHLFKEKQIKIYKDNIRIYNMKNFKNK